MDKKNLYDNSIVNLISKTKKCVCFRNFEMNEWHTEKKPNPKHNNSMSFEHSMANNHFERFFCSYIKHDGYKYEE